MYDLTGWKESSSGPGDIRFDIIAPCCIHDSGSTEKQMSAEIYCDYVDTHETTARRTVNT